MTRPEPESDDLLRSLDETHARLEQQFLGQPAAFTPDPSITVIPKPQPVEPERAPAACAIASIEWHAPITRLRPQPGLEESSSWAAQDTTSELQDDRGAASGARDSLATVSLASVGEQRSVESIYTRSTFGDCTEAGGDGVLSLAGGNMEAQTSRICAMLRRDSKGKFRLILKRDERGDVYVGTLQASDSKDERDTVREGDYIRSIDGVTVADVGFHGLLQHVKDARDSIVLEVDRTLPLRVLEGDTAVLAGALGRLGIVEERAVAMAAATAEREQVLITVGLNTIAVAELASGIHRTSQEVKQSCSVLGDWWKERSEAAGSGLASLVHAAAPTLRERTEDIGHTLQQLGGELQVQADHLLKRAIPAVTGHQKSNPPPPPPPPPLPPLCAAWAASSFPALSSHPPSVQASSCQAAAAPVASINAPVSSRSAALNEAPSSLRVSSFGWGEPIVQHAAVAANYAASDDMRAGARSAQQLHQFSEEDLREMDDASVMALAMRHSMVDCGAKPAPAGDAPSLSLCNSHDGPPFVVEVD
eukprot:scaffold6230_cov127-Isochrysis_galbana.AAC.2